MTIFTIGHSVHSAQDFLALLQKSGIECLVDVRSFPRSRRNPQFNQETLRESIERQGIHHSHVAELGGFRKRSQASSPNEGWETDGFRNYADHMSTSEFKQGIRTLIELGQDRSTVVLCAEANPYRCHRRLISDYLQLISKINVIHIFPGGNQIQHKNTRFALIEGNQLIYPVEQPVLFNSEIET